MCGDVCIYVVFVGGGNLMIWCRVLLLCVLCSVWWMVGLENSLVSLDSSIRC